MKGKLRFVSLGLVPGLVALALFASQSPSTGKTSNANNVLARQLAAELNGRRLPGKSQHVSSGVMYTLLQASGALDARAKGLKTGPLGLSSSGTQGCKRTFVGTSVNDVRVNQDCSLRRQAEEVVVMNPTDHSNLIAGQNDSRIGFNHCGYDWSFDGGTTWGDQVPPFWQVFLGDGHTADACSDPSATFDSAGNAYVTGVFFEVNDAPNGIFVAKSNAGIGGAFYHSPLVQSFQTYRDTPMGVVANDTDPNIFNDKEFIVADAGVPPATPKSNNVYLTWTRFNADTGQGVGLNSPIYFSQSTDGGATWSDGIEISGSNADACTDFSGETDPNACDQDQGSHPIVGRDGTVYVAFGNGNTPEFGLNQHMIVSCPPSADCSNATNWTAPVKISDDYGTQPFGPDSSTGCPGGRQCLPPNGYRLDDFVEGSLSVDANGRLYFAWADYRNGDSPNCPALGDADSSTPPCNNDVFYKYSTDGGDTWLGQPGAYTDDAVRVTPPRVFHRTAQWQPWSAVSLFGKSLWIAFYDRHYGNCENTGCNDITLATVASAATPTPTFSWRRLTTGSMPNLVVANNPLQAGFLGDYMWVSALGNIGPLVVWADTRGLRGSVEEDVYFAKLK